MPDRLTRHRIPGAVIVLVEEGSVGTVKVYAAASLYSTGPDLARFVAACQLLTDEVDRERMRRMAGGAPAWCR